MAISLNDIALRYKSDKASWGHNYTKLYTKYFAELRDKPIQLMEIGIGDHGGDTFRIWNEYFPNAKHLIGIDNNRNLLNKAQLLPKVSTHWADQGNIESLEILSKHIKEFCGELDIIIDDGSHENKHIINTFEILFPLLKNGGYYIIEDTYKSYIDIIPGITSIQYFSNLIPSLDFKISGLPNKEIATIHFYPEIIIIQKA